MKIGYIRVSRDKQTTALQEDAMSNEHCERVFTDKMSGNRLDRPEFLRMLDIARPGDVIVGYCQLNGNCRVISSGFKVKVGHGPKFCPKKHARKGLK